MRRETLCLLFSVIILSENGKFINCKLYNKTRHSYIYMLRIPIGLKFVLKKGEKKFKISNFLSTGNAGPSS